MIHIFVYVDWHMKLTWPIIFNNSLILCFSCLDFACILSNEIVLSVLVSLSFHCNESLLLPPAESGDRVRQDLASGAFLLCPVRVILWA